VNDAGFEKVSLTARLAAYMRQFSDIPFAQDVAQRVRAEEAFKQLLQEHQMQPEDLLWYAPIFEVRYKSIVEAIRKSGIRQVLELASGLTLRGLALVLDQEITYVETDLKEFTAEKAELVAHLHRLYNLKLRGDLYLGSANALDLQQLHEAAQFFDSAQPIAVVNEGLFPYLSSEEMEQVAQNVRDLLAEFGGVWITPDFSFKEEVTEISEQQRRFRAVVEAATERRMYNNAFANEEDLLRFFERMGLRSRVLNAVDEAPDIVSMETLKLPQRILERAKPRLRLWILEVRTRG
jgi:O-methyltransferase involved in polyketide biosynthesis